MPREIGDTLRPWRGERSWLSTESLCPPHPHLRALSQGPSCSFWDCPSPHQVAAVGDPREGPTGPHPSVQLLVWVQLVDGEEHVTPVRASVGGGESRVTLWP